MLEIVAYCFFTVQIRYSLPGRFFLVFKNTFKALFITLRILWRMFSFLTLLSVAEKSTAMPFSINFLLKTCNKTWKCINRNVNTVYRHWQVTFIKDVFRFLSRFVRGCLKSFFLQKVPIGGKNFLCVQNSTIANAVNAIMDNFVHICPTLSTLWYPWWAAHTTGGILLFAPTWLGSAPSSVKETISRENARSILQCSTVKESLNKKCPSKSQ